MKEFFETYVEHQEDIEFFLQESLKNSGILSNHKKIILLNFIKFSLR